MLKIAVIVGHTYKSQGARSFKGVTEYIWNSRVARYMEERSLAYSDLELKVFMRDHGGRKEAAINVSGWGADVSIELHFNAVGFVAYGCEALVIEGDEKSAAFADLVTNKLADKYSLKERHRTNLLSSDYEGDGVKELDRKSRGYWNLRYVKNEGVDIAILIEPCFMDTKNRESELIHDDQKGYGEFLVDFIADGHDIKISNDFPINHETQEMVMLDEKDLLIQSLSVENQRLKMALEGIRTNISKTIGNELWSL